VRTNVYIDGFNFYYGCMRRSPHKWLDLERFCDAVLPKNEVQRIIYCTAKVLSRARDPDQPLRQLTYLRALATLPRVQVEFGNFLVSVVRAPLVESDPHTGRWLMAANQPVLKCNDAGDVQTDWILKTEEKGSDVNLGAHLLRDAYRGDCDCAVVVSNDSDLLTPLRMAKADCGIVIGLLPPRPRGSAELKQLASFIVRPRAHHFADAQFPTELKDQHGVITKPDSW
jgi:uncharacterized LabA/DUF88 family protein